MALNIKQAIKARGMEVREVAKRMGITSVTMSHHINGNPTVAILQRIADVLDCDIVELFDEPAERKLSPAESTPVPAAAPKQYICPQCGTKFQILD